MFFHPEIVKVPMTTMLVKSKKKIIRLHHKKLVFRTDPVDYYSSRTDHELVSSSWTDHELDHEIIRKFWHFVNKFVNSWSVHEQVHELDHEKSRKQVFVTSERWNHLFLQDCSYCTVYIHFFLLDLLTIVYVTSELNSHQLSPHPHAPHSLSHTGSWVFFTTKRIWQ